MFPANEIYERAATDPLVQAVESAVRAGMTVVAAGNRGINPFTGQVGYTGISSRGPTWFDAYEKRDVIAPAGAVIRDRFQRSSTAMSGQSAPYINWRRGRSSMCSNQILDGGDDELLE